MAKNACCLCCSTAQRTSLMLGSIISIIRPIEPPEVAPSRVNSQVGGYPRSDKGHNASPEVGPDHGIRGIGGSRDSGVGTPEIQNGKTDPAIQPKKALLTPKNSGVDPRNCPDPLLLAPKFSGVDPRRYPPINSRYYIR